MTTQLVESPERQYRRIFSCLSAWRQHTVLAAKAYYEAKVSGCWHAHHRTWKDFMEACGFTEEWGRQLAKTGQQIVELEAFIESPERCNSVAPEKAVLLEKTHEITPGMRKVLDGIPTASQVEILQKAGKPGKPLTVKDVKEAKAAVIPTPERVAKVIDLDKTEAHMPIPAGILEDWNRAEEVGRELCGLVSKVKCVVVKAQEDKDALFGEVNHSAAIGHLEAAYTDLKRIIPHAVCTCGGKGCRSCHGRGFVSEAFYRQCVPESTRKMRERKK